MIKVTESKESLELKDILVKTSGWKSFLTPVHKKVLPVIIPSGVLGFVVYNVAQYFVGKMSLSYFQSKLFLAALVFLYLWFVLLLFLLSCLVYTVAEAYQKKGSEVVMERLKFKRY